MYNGLKFQIESDVITELSKMIGKDFRTVPDQPRRSSVESLRGNLEDDGTGVG